MSTATLKSVNDGQAWLAGGIAFALVGAALLLVLTKLMKPVELAHYHPNNARQTALADWDRSRLEGISKGFGAIAATFLTSVFVALLKGDIAARVSLISIVGCLLGVAGCLLVAVTFYVRAGRWARRHVDQNFDEWNL